MTNNKPFFSVVIPLYNKERHIKRAIDSVLNQKYKNLELLIINDGSLDNSENIVKEYNDSRIKYYKQKNQGVSSARNNGIEKSTANFIAFLDADDKWENDFLTTILESMKRYPDKLVFSTAVSFINKNGNMKKTVLKTIPNFGWTGEVDNLFKTIVYDDVLITSSSVCIHKDVFTEVGKFPLNIKRGEDIDTWIRIFLKYTIIFSSEIKVTIYKDEEGGSDTIAGIDKNNSYVIEKLEEKIKKHQIPDNMILDAQKLTSKLYYWEVSIYIQHRKFILAFCSLFNKRLNYIPHLKVKLLIKLLIRLFSFKNVIRVFYDKNK